MAEPITLKGIQRNATKLEVEDGRAEDLINLRFKDGSWRTAGDGKRVFAMEDLQGGHTYEQLYIHTNSPYHHLLGVENGVLYWFANIADDGETFDEVERQEICNVVGDLWISQTGHLITIIDNENRFRYFLFKTATKLYSETNIDINGSQDSRELYPYGRVNFNLYEPVPLEPDRHTVHRRQESTSEQDIENNTRSILGESLDSNLFTRPFLACVAIRLYDGTFAYASAPVMLWPRQKISSQEVLYRSDRLHREDIEMVDGYPIDYYDPSDTSDVEYQSVAYIGRSDYVADSENRHLKDILKNRDFRYARKYKDETASGGLRFETGYTNAAHIPAYMAYKPFENYEFEYYSQFILFGSDLVVNLAKYDFIKNNREIFKSLCVFISPQVDYFNYDKDHIKIHYLTYEFSASGYPARTYFFPRRKYSDIINDLKNSQFFLLTEYDYFDIDKLKENPIIDLTGEEFVGRLKNLAEQEPLEYDSTIRTTYLPRVQYSYNGRLHMANYLPVYYHGHNIESFQLNNQSVEYEEGQYYPSTDAGLKVLRNIKTEMEVVQKVNDEYVYAPTDTQWSVVRKDILPNGADEDNSLIENNSPVFWIDVMMLKDDGIKHSIRYIKAYDTSVHEDGVQDFLEGLSPMLSYPDTTARTIRIYRVVNRSESAIGDGDYSVVYKEYYTKQMSYFNISLAFEEYLKPIKLQEENVDGWKYIVDDENNIRSFTALELKSLVVESSNESYGEYIPNGLKVTKTNNPLVFPVENTYQVGAGTILALCANAIAVGTGQTGAAPLYVFCTDGIYALYVDASGEMAYTNARIIARDVCNNSKSVTPIDTGVVFTTDRGLMEIAGDVVNEIGQPAEGDVVDYTEPDWAKPRNVGKNILTKVANLPLNLVDGVDFLRYLTGAIINYNHNERELMVSNPDYPYSYVLDRYSNWSRRDYSADEYVNNYPTSYRVKDGVFYKVDAEQDGLEGKSEAPNDFLYLSNVIKLGSVDFKKAYRFVVRGKFDTNEMRNTSFYSPTSSVVLYDKTQEENIIKTLVNGKPYTIRPKYDDAYRYIYRLTIYDNNNQEIFSGETVNGVIEFTVSNWGNVSFISFEKVDSAYPTHEHNISIENTHVLGCYVFGSYDGRQFAMLGANEKKGTFTDIGCKVERTDVKYFRVGLAGHLSGDSRIDFMEVEGEKSNLTTKLR